MFPVPAIALEIRSDLIRLVLAKFQFFAEIGVECADERAADGGFLRIVVRGFTDEIVSWPSEARIESAGGQSAVALQLLHELEKSYAQVSLDKVVLAQSSEASHFLGDCGFFFGANGIALHEGRRVLTLGKFPCFVQKYRKAVRAILENLVVPRSCSVTGQVQNVGEILPRIEGNCSKIEDGRDHNDAVQINVVVVLQVVCEGGVSKCAVALPDQEFRRVPAIVARDINLDELREQLDVGIYATKIFVLFFANGRAETCSDRIDEDEIRAIEQAIGVVEQFVWRGRSHSCVHRGDAARPKRAHVQPNRRRTGAAVVQERERSSTGILHVAAGVSRRVDERNRRAFIALQQNRLRGGFVRDSLSADLDRVI